MAKDNFLFSLVLYEIEYTIDDPENKVVSIHGNMRNILGRSITQAVLQSFETTLARELQIGTRYVEVKAIFNTSDQRITLDIKVTAPETLLRDRIVISRYISSCIMEWQKHYNPPQQPQGSVPAH